MLVPSYYSRSMLKEHNVSYNVRKRTEMVAASRMYFISCLRVSRNPSRFGRNM